MLKFNPAAIDWVPCTKLGGDPIWAKCRRIKERFLFLHMAGTEAGTFFAGG